MRSQQSYAARHRGPVGHAVGRTGVDGTREEVAVGGRHPAFHQLDGREVVGVEQGEDVQRMAGRVHGDVSIGEQRLPGVAAPHVDVRLPLARGLHAGGQLQHLQHVGHAHERGHRLHALSVQHDAARRNAAEAGASALFYGDFLQVVLAGVARGVRRRNGLSEGHPGGQQQPHYA